MLTKIKNFIKKWIQKLQQKLQQLKEIVNPTPTVTQVKKTTKIANVKKRKKKVNDNGFLKDTIKKDGRCKI